MRILLLAACLAVGSCGNPTEPSYPVFQVTRATIEVPPRAPSFTATGATCPTGVGLLVYVIGPADQAHAEEYTYRWERSDGTVDGPSRRTIPVSAGSGPYADHYTYFVSIPNTQTGWIQLHVLAPNDQLSNRVTWDVTCK